MHLVLLTLVFSEEKQWSSGSGEEGKWGVEFEGREGRMQLGCIVGEKNK